MNNKFKVTIFGILLIMLMSVAVAAEVSDDTTTVDTIAEEVEPVATEVTSPQTDNILEENDIETDMVYSGENPQIISTLENETTYENAEITLNNDVTYSDAQVTFGNNVTLTANGNTLTNVKININGNNVTITNVNFTHNVQSDAKVINIDHASNVTLNNVNIDLYKTESGSWNKYETKAISITNSSCVKVNSSNIEVSTESQGISWESDDGWQTWYSVLKVSAVVIDQSTGVCFTNNNVNIYSNAGEVTNTTMPGIIVRYGTSNSCIKNNSINVTGSHYNYGIMCSDYVSNLSIRDNDIRVIGEKNVVGIDASTSTGSVVYNNTIYANSTNTLGLAPTEQSLAYGILTNTYYNGNANNYVAYNNINLTGTVCYGIENYMGNNNTFNHNTVDATGTTAMGLGSWGSTNCKIINNNFIITGNDTVANTFYEQISPQNVGIILTGNTTYPSTNNLITGNTVNLTFAGSDDVFTIVITNESTSNTIYNNSLKSDCFNGGTGNSTVSINSSNNNVESNDNCTEYEFDDSNLLVCNCACCSQISTIQDVENISFLKKRNVLVKTSSSPIILNSQNFNQYITDGLLNDNVTEGDVIDIDGLLEGSKYAFSVNKPVNITSSKGNAYLIFNSSSQGDQYSFNITKSGSGSNITNINFHNTHVRTEEAANVTFNNISLTCDKGIGFGVGAISIRSSDNVNITNSYFKSKDNAGHSTVVYATSNNCLFENNTVLGEGYVGNLFYITTYGGSGFSYNITVRNNYIDNTKAYNQSICQAMVISGAGHLIENNTIVANEWALGIQYYDPDFGEEGNPGEGTSIVKDNYIVQGRMAKTENVTYVNNVLPEEILVINDENWDKYLFFVKSISFDINFTSIENTNLKIIYNATKRVNIDCRAFTSPLENYTRIRIMAANQYLNMFLSLHDSGYYLPYTSIQSYNTSNLYDSIIKSAMKTTVYNTFFLNENSAILGDNEYMQGAGSRPSNPVTYQIVTNENYMNYFDEETGIIKDDLSSYNFVIDGEINKSLIFNKSVNLRGFNNIEGYTLIKNSTLNNVKFIEGSENSNISCLKINNLTIQDTSNINIENNTIDGLLILNNSQFCKIIFNDMDVAGRRITHPDSNIILYGSFNNIIKDNIIRTHGRFAISLDNLSYENLIEDNDLSSSGSYIMSYGKSFFDCYGKDCIENNGTNTLFNNSINPKYNLKLNTKTFAVNQENTLNVNVNCEEFTVTNGKVIFSLNGTYLGEANVENGVASLTFTPTELGSSSLSAWYVSDELDMPKGLTETATVKDLIGTNVLIDYSGKVNSESFVTFTVTDEDGNPMNDGQLTYSFATGEEKTITLTENTVTIPLEDTEHIAGKEVKVTYTSADSKYSSQTNTTTLDLEKANTQFTAVYDVVDDNNGNLTITLTDEFGNPLKEYKFNLVVDGVKTLETTDNNGVKVVSINSDKKEIEITATYLGNGAFVNSTLTKTVKLVKDPTTITVTSNKPTVSETLEINGTLKDEEKAISNAEVILSVNDENITLTTDENGEFTYSVEQPDKGSYTIIATFKGDENYKESTAKTKTYVKDPENVDVDDVLYQLEELKEQNQKQVEELQKNNEELQEQLNNLTQLNEELKEQLDNLTKDNNDLSEQLNDTKNNLTQQNNDLQEQNKELSDKLDSTAKNLTDANKALQEQNENAQKQLDNLSKANDELKEQLTNTTKDLTDSNNDLKEQNKALQDQNKQLNDKLDAILKQLEDSVAKDAVITVNSIPGAKFGQNVTITGKLSDCDGNVIASSPVSVSVGGSAQKVTTDNNGVYTLTVKASVVGDNSVVVSFDANNKYNYAENTTTFKVTRQNLVLKLDSIKAVYYGDKVKVTGVLSDANGKLIANTLLNLDINGKTVKVKTVAGGKFTYTVAAKTVGTNNVTVSYNGNKNYNSVSAKKTFKVYKQGLKITVNKITGTKYKNTVKVTGKLTDANGKVIMNTLVNININGKAYTAKTNNKGVYTLTLKATSIGVNNVTVSYKGNKNYKKATAKTTFKVAKQNVKVTLTGSSYSNAKATITGKLVDANNKVLMNSNVKITINNKTYNAKTNTEGTYTLTKPVTSKKITLTLAYNGNKNYNAYKKTSNVTLA